jgi:hypothetical protein
MDEQARDELDERSKRLFDASVGEIDPATLASLRAARARVA